MRSVVYPRGNAKITLHLALGLRAAGDPRGPAALRTVNRDAGQPHGGGDSVTLAKAGSAIDQGR